MLKEERSVGNRITNVNAKSFRNGVQKFSGEFGSKVVCMCTLQPTDGLDDECINMVLRVLRILVL